MANGGSPQAPTRTRRPKMKARIDFERCTGHGRCYALCPEVFAEDDTGYPTLDDSPIPDGLADRVRRAADNCPESAIALVGGENSGASDE